MRKNLVCTLQQFQHIDILELNFGNTKIVLMFRHKKKFCANNTGQNLQRLLFLNLYKFSN